MTLLTELVILGLFAMSLDLMVGYTRLVSFGHVAAYGLGAYASGYLLLNTSMPLPFAVLLAALMTGIVAIGVGWVCTLATGVSFSMLTLAFAQLLYAIAFKWTSVTGGSDGLAGIPRRAGPMGITLLTTKTGFYYFALACLIGSYSAVPQARRLALRRGAARHPRERGQDARARLQHAPLQDRRRRHRLRARRAGRRALCAVRRLRQHRAAVLAAVGPGADHGDRRRLRHADRADPRRRLLPDCSSISSPPTRRRGPCSSVWSSSASSCLRREGIWGLATRLVQARRAALGGRAAPWLKRCAQADGASRSGRLAAR